MDQGKQIAQLTEQVSQLLEQNRALLALLATPPGLNPLAHAPSVIAGARGIACANKPKLSKRETLKQTLLAFAHDSPALRRQPNLQAQFIHNVNKMK